MSQVVKHLPTMRETQLRSLDRGEPLEKEMATHFSTLALKIPWTEECGRLQSLGSQRKTRLSDFTFTSSFLVPHLCKKIHGTITNEERCEIMKYIYTY